jgi:hypothetical protein
MYTDSSEIDSGVGLALGLSHLVSQVSGMRDHNLEGRPLFKAASRISLLGISLGSFLSFPVLSLILLLFTTGVDLVALFIDFDSKNCFDAVLGSKLVGDELVALLIETDSPEGLGRGLGT